MLTSLCCSSSRTVAASAVGLLFLGADDFLRPEVSRDFLRRNPVFYMNNVVNFVVTDYSRSVLVSNHSGHKFKRAEENPGQILVRNFW